MREFVAASGSLSFTGADRKEIYGLVKGTWQARPYLRLSKKDKGVRASLASLPPCPSVSFRVNFGAKSSTSNRILNYTITPAESICGTNSKPMLLTPPAGAP